MSGFASPGNTADTSSRTTCATKTRRGATPRRGSPMLAPAFTPVHVATDPTDVTSPLPSLRSPRATRRGAVKTVTRARRSFGRVRRSPSAGSAAAPDDYWHAALTKTAVEPEQPNVADDAAAACSGD